MLAGTRHYRRLAYREVLDRLSDLGKARARAETREAHARRLADLSPNLLGLTRVHLAGALGGRSANRQHVRMMVAAVRKDLRRSIPLWRRAIAMINPIGWIWTR